MNSIVNVYILTSDENNERVRKLKKLFLNEIFDIIVITISPISGIETKPSIKNNQSLNSQRIIKCLNKSRIHNLENYTIIIKDTSISSSSSEVVTKVILKLIEISQKVNWDIAYLNKWLDRCDLYNSEKNIEIEDLSIYITETFSPNGTQALMFSKDGRDRILGLKPLLDNSSFIPFNNSIDLSLHIAIENKKLIAYTVVPNLFEYNIIFSENISDIVKSHDCRIPNLVKEEKGILPFLWFIIAILGTILLIWAARKIGPKEKNIKNIK